VTIEPGQDKDHLAKMAFASSSIFESQKNLFSPLQPIIEQMSRNQLEFTNHFKPIFEQVHQAHFDFAYNLKPMFEQFNQTHFDLAERFKPVFDQANLFVPVFDDLIRGFERLNRELHEKHEQDMVFLPPFFNEYTLPEIRELLLDSDKSAIDVYYEIFSNRENLDKLLQQWKKNPHFTEERMEILSDALDAHINKKYTLATPALIGQLEGLMLEAFEIEQGQIPWAVKVSFPKGKNDSYLSHTKGSYVMQDILLSEVFNSSKKVGYAPKGIYPHRPTIQHGVNTSYYKNTHATTRLIMLIDFISSDDFQDGAKQFKLKRAASPQETPTV
jgi:AraC-like DNA-binding protein